VVVLTRECLALHLTRSGQATKIWEVPVTAVEGPPWTAALAVLGQAIERESLSDATALSVIVAGDLVRLRVVPWNPEFVAPQARAAYVRYCFEEIFGTRVQSWTCRVSSEAYGAAALACAMDTELIEGLETQAQRLKLRLVSVQPSLMRAYQSVRNRLSAAVFWFALVEPDARVTLLLMRGGSVDRVRVLNRTAGVEQALEQLPQSLDREWMTAGQEAQPCPVYLFVSQTEGAGVGARQSDLMGRWSVSNVQPVGATRGLSTWQPLLELT
jgi:hypothetical protein